MTDYQATLLFLATFVLCGTGVLCFAMWLDHKGKNKLPTTH